MLTVMGVSVNFFPSLYTLKPVLYRIGRKIPPRKRLLLKGFREWQLRRGLVSPVVTLSSYNQVVLSLLQQAVT